MILTLCPGKGLIFVPRSPPMDNPHYCCACLERPATLFGGYFCGPCYGDEPLPYLAACRAAKDRGAPHPDAPAYSHTHGWHDPATRAERLAGKPLCRGGIAP